MTADEVSVGEAILVAVATLVVGAEILVVAEEVEETHRVEEAIEGVVIVVDVAATSKLTEGDLKTNSRTTDR